MPPPVLLLPVLLLLLLLPVELVLLWGDFCCGIPFTMPMFSTLMLPVVVMVLLLLLLWWILLLLKLLMMVLLLLLAEFFRPGDVLKLEKQKGKHLLLALRAQGVAIAEKT